MTNVPYNTNIPFASNSPSQDQPRMQENTNSLKSLIEIDHIGFGNNQGGYHQDIHQPVLPVGGETAWNPLIGSAGRLAVEAAAIPGLQQLFPLNYTTDSNTPSTDSQLFSMTANGVVSQLTGNSTGTITDGWCWVGGILLQWGTHTSAGLSSTITFKGRNGTTDTIPFPNNCFGVWIQNGTGSLTKIFTASLISKTDFTWVANSITNTFYWLAIGN